MEQLGRRPSDKALAVNLDPTLYGSFAEIGAGQEVSRTFLKAGAAAGTVARSISAYDMRMSDVSYGTAKRYVTNERLQQMLTGEYKECEKCLREIKGDDCRFFAFASTLAAKAYMSDRECEGWVGVTYQHEAGQERSTVSLHVRMSDETAELQGEAIGVLGTNLIYLINSTKDPYLIATFLLDGLNLNDGVEVGRLEIDYINFEGPGFPEGSWDPRLLAMRMVQLRLCNAVLLEPGEASGKYHQAVPNNAMYKRPLVVQRSRFAPVTNMHKEVMEACQKRLAKDMEEGTKPILQVLNLQVDDLTPPTQLVETNQKLKNMTAMTEADTNNDGHIDLQELEAMVGDRMSNEEIEQIFKSLDVENAGRIAIDELFSISDESFVATEFIDRFAMLEPLGYPVLISNIRRTHKLATYLRRYTNQKIAIAVGGGGFSIQRALFDVTAYRNTEGGMLEALGRLFSQGRNQVFTYPNIGPEGDIMPATVPEGQEKLLYDYLVGTGAIVPIGTEYMSPAAQDSSANQSLRLGSTEVRDVIREGSSEWEKYVPSEVLEIVKTRQWFKRVLRGDNFAKTVYQFLATL